MTRVLTDARLALILLAWLLVVGVTVSMSFRRCAVSHRVVIDGRVFQGGCTPARPLAVALSLMALAPAAAVAAMARPRGSLKRSLGLVALIALELALIISSPPGRMLTHPHLLRRDPGRGWSLILAASPWDRGRPYGPEDIGWEKQLEIMGAVRSPLPQRPSASSSVSSK